MTRTFVGLATAIALTAPWGLATAAHPSPDSAAGIRGHVRDAGSGAPVAGAQVFVEGTALGTLTDAEGFYSIPIRDEARIGATVTVVVRLIGYAEARRSVTVEEAGETTVDFELEQTALRLQDIVAQGAEAASPRVTLPFTVEREAARASGVPPGRYHPDFHTESYAYIDENDWRSPERAPLSTFSIDVDRASYSNVRRFIHAGERPPVDAVRIEEMINYFPYDDPEPEGAEPFAVVTEVARAPWNGAHRLVRIGIQGRRVDLENLPPSNLVFLLDVSGSMQAANKLPLLKRSLRLLVNELRPEDRVAIVVYAGAAGLVLEPTPGRHKDRILAAIEELEAGGSTAGGAGLRLAYRVAAESRLAEGNDRVILATDGDFNVGASSDAEMRRLIERERERGIFLTVLGFGMGNLKDSKMEALADHGNGNYAYIDNLLEARKVLVTEMGGTLLTIARDVKVQVEFNPARVQAYRLIGYENRLLRDEDFNDDAVDAGELGAGHSVTALYEVVPAGAPSVATGSVDPLRYGAAGGGTADRGDGGRAASDSAELLFVKLRYKAPGGDRSRLIERAVGDRVTEGSADLRFAAAVAAFGMRLRDSEHCDGFPLDAIARLAVSAVGEDPHGYRSEFVRLVRAVEGMGWFAEP